MDNQSVREAVANLIVAHGTSDPLRLAECIGLKVELADRDLADFGAFADFQTITVPAELTLEERKLRVAHMLCHRVLHHDRVWRIRCVDELAHLPAEETAQEFSEMLMGFGVALNSVLHLTAAQVLPPDRTWHVTIVEGFEYEVPHGLTGRCDLEIRKLGGKAVVVASERLDNRGLSVTNAAELIATTVCKDFHVHPEDVIWYERYPGDPRLASSRPWDTLDRVRLRYDGTRFVMPEWIPATQSEFSEYGLFGRPDSLEWTTPLHHGFRP